MHSRHTTVTVMSTCQLMFLPFVFSLLLDAPHGRRMTLGKRVPEALSSTQQPLLLHPSQRHHGIQVCPGGMNACAESASTVMLQPLI